jgi:type IV pilus assembly protein PilC
MEFTCRLGTAAGEVIEGVYVADNEARLRRELEEKGLYVLDLRPRGLRAWSALQLRGRPRVSTAEFLVLNQELATLLKAGMPLVQSLDILRQRVPNPAFKSVLDDVHERVRGGSALSEAFAAHGDLFPGVYTASLFAGEKSGGLEQVIRRYVAYVKVVSGVKRRTISALVYPIVLLVLASVVVGIIVLKVVPEFAAFYGGFGAELPLSTRAIVAISGVAAAYFPLFVLGTAAAAGTFWFWVRQPGQRARFHWVVLRLPLVGPTARKFATSQAARTLATLLGGGIPLVTALEIAGRSIGNRHMARELDRVSQEVREGRGMALAMAERGAFPDVAIKMVEVGESTGALQDMLNSLADFYDDEIETNLARFVTLVEPVLLVVMGLVIAALLLALYTPLFELTTVLR